MKTIGILLGSLSGAGAEKSLLTLAMALAKRGNTVHILLLNATYDFIPPDYINVHVLEGNDSKQALIEQSSAIHFDLFICSRVELYDCVQCRNTWGFVCITPTAWIDTPRWQFLNYNRAIKKLHKYHNKKLIAVSKGVAEDLVHNIGVDKRNVKVIYDAYDFDEILTNSNASSDIPQDYIVMVAALKKRKGHDLAIRSLARLNNKKIKLVFLGKGEKEASLKKLARKLGMSERVVFKGWTSNPYAYIKNARLSLLTSTAEGLPRTMVESLVLGTPVVATDCRSGPNELLTGQLKPYLVPMNNIAMLANAIEQALEYYPDIDSHKLEQFRSEYAAECYESL